MQFLRIDAILYVCNVTANEKLQATSISVIGKQNVLGNHLGNVLVTISDKPIYKVSSGTIYFNPEISSSSDYYPFGAPIAGRSAAFGSEYRFGYNTQEKTDEIAGPGNHNTAQFWEYDGRLGRRWNLDPVVKPWESLYACLSDNPILLNDPDGNEPGNPRRYIVVKGDNLTKIGNKYGVSVDNLVKWNNIPKRNEIKIGQSLIVSDPTKVKQPEGFVWWQSENSPSTNSPKPIKTVSKIADSKTKNINSDRSGWLDNVQAGLDVTGIADPTGVVDGVNALIYLGRGQWENAGISALAIIPYIGDLGKAERLGAKTLQLTSKSRTAEKGLEIGERFLGTGYKEIAPGVFRSSDNLRQFRMTDADILGKHGNIGPHFNFEILDASGNFLRNYLMPIR